MSSDSESVVELPGQVDIDVLYDEKERMIDFEGEVWGKHSQSLYNFFIHHVLDWSSLTVQWLPEIAVSGRDKFAFHKVILGTHTEGEQNYLLLASVKLPRECDSDDDEDEDDEELIDITEDDFPQNVSQKVVNIDKKIKHDGEVHRARYMPQNPSLIATKSPNADVFVFNTAKHPLAPLPTEHSRPDLVLRGHELQGYGLSWNSYVDGHLLSASLDKTICLWDINATQQKDRVIDAMRIFTGHDGVVADVAWHMLEVDLFASVSEDGQLMIWDTRQSDSHNPCYAVTAHNQDVNCVAFSPYSEYSLTTGSADNTVALWDMRNMKMKLYSLECNTEELGSGEVFQVQWSPTDETILASGGTDRRLNVWDLSRIGATLKPEEELDGPPELLFVHGGHSDTITDFAWNANEPWIISSVSADNILHVWRMSDVIYSHEKTQEDTIIKTGTNPKSMDGTHALTKEPKPLGNPNSVTELNGDVITPPEEPNGIEEIIVIDDDEPLTKSIESFPKELLNNSNCQIDNCKEVDNMEIAVDNIEITVVDSNPSIHSQDTQRCVLDVDVIKSTDPSSNGSQATWYNGAQSQSTEKKVCVQSSSGDLQIFLGPSRLVEKGQDGSVEEVEEEIVVID